MDPNMIISSFTGSGKTIIILLLAALSAYIDVYKERNNDQRGVLKPLKICLYLYVLLGYHCSYIYTKKLSSI